MFVLLTLRDVQTDPQQLELLHVRQAADELDVHPSTVRRHIANGELRALRLGANGSLRIRRRDLEAFLEPNEAA